MRKFRSTAVFAVVAASAVVALTGCSGPSTSAPTAESTRTGPAKITWWSNLGGMDLVAAAYNESQDDIEVTFEQVPAPEAGGLEKLTNALKAGNAPCAATVSTTDLTSLATQGAFLPLDDIAGDVLADFPQSARDTVDLGGSTWAFPQATGAMTYFYRQDIFDQAGVDVPETWDDFRRAAADVRAAVPGTYIASFVNQDIRFLAGWSPRLALSGSRLKVTSGPSTSPMTRA